MSPSVEDIRKAAEARMRELGPVIKEIEQLREILQVTAEEASDENAELAVAGAAALAQAERSHNGVRRPLRGPDGRAVRGSNKTVIMELACSHPGIAAPEIAALTDLKREVVSATVYRLKKQGLLEDYGKGVRVAVAPAKQRNFILDLADSKPGITAAEIADVTGLDPTLTAVTIESMQKKGELEPLEGGVGLPSAVKA